MHYNTKIAQLFSFRKQNATNISSKRNNNCYTYNQSAAKSKHSFLAQCHIIYFVSNEIECHATARCVAYVA